MTKLVFLLLLFLTIFDNVNNKVDVVGGDVVIVYDIAVALAAVVVVVSFVALAAVVVVVVRWKYCCC